MICDSLGAKPLLVNLIPEVLEVCNDSVQGFIVNRAWIVILLCMTLIISIS
jgi:hypothetical protein